MTLQYAVCATTTTTIIIEKKQKKRWQRWLVTRNADTSTTFLRNARLLSNDLFVHSRILVLIYFISFHFIYIIILSCYCCCYLLACLLLFLFSFSAATYVFIINIYWYQTQCVSCMHIFTIAKVGCIVNDKASRFFVIIEIFKKNEFLWENWLINHKNPWPFRKMFHLFSLTMHPNNIF